MQTVISFVHADCVLVFVVTCFCNFDVSIARPAALHDFSINSSYVSSTSSVVQFATIDKHFSVAHMYRSPGSDGADFKSRAEIVFFDAAVPTARRFVGGVPASAVPQYWHRADGFADKFIAHAESKHRVKFMREHVAAVAIPGVAIKPMMKIAILIVILSRSIIISKKSTRLK